MSSVKYTFVLMPAFLSSGRANVTLDGKRCKQTAVKVLHGVDSEAGSWKFWDLLREPLTCSLFLTGDWISVSRFSHLSSVYLCLNKGTTTCYQVLYTTGELVS